MVRIMIQLTEEQLKALKTLAKARKTSVAKLVREGVAQYVTAAQNEPVREERWRRALEFIKKSNLEKSNSMIWKAKQM